MPSYPDPLLASCAHRFCVAYAVIDAATARQLRRLAQHTLVNWGYVTVSDDVAVVVGELLSNVQRHARSGCTLRVRADGASVTVAVRDESQLVPVIPTRNATLTAASGRGLWLVRALCTSFRFQPVGAAGKVALAELAVVS